MPHTRRKHDPEFKAGAVRIVRQTRRSVVEIAGDLGIGAGTLGNWVRKDRYHPDGETVAAAPGQYPAGCGLQPRSGQPDGCGGGVVGRHRPC